MKKILILAVVVAVGILGAGGASSQSAVLEYPGSGLTHSGIELREIPAFDGSLPEQSAVAASESRFGGGKVKTATLAFMSRPAPLHSGPVWVMEMDVSGLGPAGQSGPPGTDHSGPELVTSRLIFIDAQTGEFLFAEDALSRD